MCRLGKVLFMLLPLVITNIVVTPMVVKSFFFCKSLVLTHRHSEVLGEVRILCDASCEAIIVVYCCRRWLNMSRTCVVSRRSV